MTVLGDLAQATAPAAQDSWEAAIGHLGSPSVASIAELELGYRVPAPILDVANRLLPSVAPEVRPSRSVRLVGPPPEIVAVTAEPDLGPAVATVVRDLTGRWGSVGVITPAFLLEAITDGLGATGIDFGSGLETGPGAAVTVLAPPDAKGLEFDAVVVVEPGSFLAEVPGVDGAGGRLLYVALTRAVQELVLVHADPLPGALGLT
ncbi:MAG: ATP-binding domain-containing protein [Acidimicrobiales bacterium]